jgi:hypothetical protein
VGDQAQEDIQQLAANTCLPGKATTPERLATLLTHVSRCEPGLRALHAPRHPVGGTECREQWVHYSKLIVGLSDEDVVQMVRIKTGGGDPAELVRQKIEDFRLGI